MIPRLNKALSKLGGRIAGSAGVSALAGVVWLGVVIGGTFLMLQFSQTPGEAGTPPTQWPKGSAVARDAGRPALVMFLHPHCPCSKASVGELERLVAQCRGQFKAHVVLLKPDGMGGDWEKTGLWERAKTIPDTMVSVDRNGAEAKLFQAATSGETMLYDGNGRLLFSGGITVARGHSGDNEGSAAIAALLGGKISNPVKTAVYGCALDVIECEQGEVACKP